MSRNWFGLAEQERKTWLNVARERHGDRVDMISQSLQQARLDYEADVLRQQLTDPEHRFIATALLLSDTRSDLLNLLAERYSDPLESLRRFIDKAGVFADDEAASAAIAHVMVDGGSADDAVKQLVETWGEAEFSGRENEIHAFYNSCAFAPLGNQ
jgi:hypothetical protein